MFDGCITLESQGLVKTYMMVFLLFVFLLVSLFTARWTSSTLLLDEAAYWLYLVWFSGAQVHGSAQGWTVVKSQGIICIFCCFHRP